MFNVLWFFNVFKNSNFINASATHHVIYALAHAELMAVMDDGGGDDERDVVRCPKNC